MNWTDLLNNDRLRPSTDRKSLKNREQTKGELYEMV
jgi:hypothetical protein